MADHKLKLTVAGQTFEAEGTPDDVERQFQIWREMVTSMPVVASPPPERSAALAKTPQTEQPPTTGLERLFNREGPVVTLGVLPTGAQAEADAAVLLLYANRELLGDPQVTGVRLMQGLSRSGVTVQRVDRLFGDYMPGYVIRSGKHRGVRYRLTTQGAVKAQQLIAELLAMIG